MYAAVTQYISCCFLTTLNWSYAQLFLTYAIISKLFSFINLRGKQEKDSA